MTSTAENLMMTAKAFALSSEALMLTGKPEHHLTILHLTATSIELSFKAWIKIRGGTEEEIRALGHHLDKAYERAVQLGLSDPSGNVGRAIATINPIYSRHFTRYFPDVDGFTGLTVESLVEVARAVALTIEGEIWPKG